MIVFTKTGEIAGREDFFDGIFRLVEINSWPYDLTIYVAVILSAYVSIYLDQIREKEKENLLLQNQLYRVKLDSLKSQLNPHFLFNALNTISGLMRMNANEKATLALAELSYMLRTVLERSNNTVLFREEITFIEKYIFFQTLRFEERLSASIKVSKEAENVSVPFLLVQTLVENAVKHGAQEDGKLNDISISAIVSDKRLHIILSNQMAEQHHANGFGIGLLNSQERLSLLYKDDFVLSCDKQEDGSYLTLIDLPIEVKDV